MKKKQARRWFVSNETKKAMIERLLAFVSYSHTVKIHNILVVVPFFNSNNVMRTTMQQKR
jgi:hypothetical protein